MGPLSLFVRIKVDHPAVQQIIKGVIYKYLNCIVIDKQDMESETVKQCILKSMCQGQSWAYVDFDNPEGKEGGREKESDGAPSAVKTGKDVAAKRKAVGEEEPSAKRIKTSEEEEEEKHSQEQTRTSYADVAPGRHPNFPTILGNFFTLRCS